MKAFESFWLKVVGLEDTKLKEQYEAGCNKCDFDGGRTDGMGARDEH